MQFTSQSFEDALQENLALFTTPPDISGKDLFQTHREVALARYALQQQAIAYARAVEILSSLLENAVNQTNQPKVLTDVMQALAAIELKSISLIRSVREVTELLGKAVNIDVDKAALSSMVIRLPSLVKDTITKVSGDSNLADRISSSLDSRLSEMMIAFRFNPDNLQAHQQHDNSEVTGITLQEYSQLHDSVPAQPVQSDNHNNIVNQSQSLN